MSNSDQIDYWNGKAGEKWALHAERLDALLAPFADAVLNRAALQESKLVLDIGCGAGALTLKAADQVGSTGQATGVDVSEPLLAQARKRAEDRHLSARFERADASQYRTRTKVDALISRFGVMFFDDPVAGFANLKQCLKPGGRMTFACWQSLAENDWARAPLEAALPLLPAPPAPPPPGAPGPFAFADQDRVAQILSDAGWSDIVIEPWRGNVTLPGDTAEEAAGFMLEIGPVARLVAEAGIDMERVRAALFELLSQHAGSDGRVPMPAAAWIVSAKAQ